MSLINKVLRRFGVHDAIYDKEYYERDVEGPAVLSAPHIAKTVVERFAPKTLIDVGCGTGAIMEAFQRLGVATKGLEYSKAGIKKCRARGLTVHLFDIERDAIPQLRGDLALSTEVAEHLPASVAPNYAKLLCTLAPVVICTAAGPGQGGTDHVNLQPKEYWIDLFAKTGHVFDRESTNKLTSQWKSSGVEGFYFENLMVFRRT